MIHKQFGGQRSGGSDLAHVVSRRVEPAWHSSAIQACVRQAGRCRTFDDAGRWISVCGSRFIEEAQDQLLSALLSQVSSLRATRWPKTIRDGFHRPPHAPWPIWRITRKLPTTLIGTEADHKTAPNAGQNRAWPSYHEGQRVPCCPLEAFWSAGRFSMSPCSYSLRLHSASCTDRAGADASGDPAQRSRRLDLWDARGAGWRARQTAPSRWISSHRYSSCISSVPGVSRARPSSGVAGHRAPAGSCASRQAARRLCGPDDLAQRHASALPAKTATSCRRFAPSSAWYSDASERLSTGLRAKPCS